MATFTYSDSFKTVKSRKKRNNRRQQERPDLYDELERAKLDLLENDWREKCQRWYPMTCYVDQHCSFFDPRFSYEPCVRHTQRVHQRNGHRTC
jgi:hypothetical protein